MQLILEILRGSQADDPFAFRLEQEDYVVRTPLGGAESAHLRWSESLLRDLEQLRGPRLDPALRQRLGEGLRRFLAQTSFGQKLDEIGLAVRGGEPVFIALRLAAAELYALPWELLALPGSGQHLGALPGVLLRYAWPDTRTAAEEPAPRPAGGRILFAWSAAAGSVPASEHQAAIAQACSRGGHPFSLARDVLPHASYQRLWNALAEAREGEPIAILHLLCHGKRSGATFGLALNDDGDRPGEGSAVVDAGRLRELVSAHAGRLRLIVLAACDSANSGELGNFLGSVAQALHRAGIAAVIASRQPLSVPGSIRLTAALYTALLEGPDSLEAAFLAARQELQKSDDRGDWAALQLYARPEDGDDTRPIIFRPYRGLEPFLFRHHRFFFGRERERQLARAALQALIEQGKPRFLIVAGASGTGKSSVVLGGLVPDLTGDKRQGGRDGEVRRALTHLRESLGSAIEHPALRAPLSQLHSAIDGLYPGGGSGPWEWAMMRPGSDPLAALQHALQARQDEARPFLLCVDQLEEIFTHVGDAALRSELLARLWRLCQKPTLCAVVVTLRVDFLGHLGELVLDETGLRLDRIAYDDAHRVFVAQLEPEQLLAAIREPARLCGLDVPKALADQMIADVAGEPGALPLLSYVLDLLWQQRQGSRLLPECYAALGGAGGALEQSADRVFSSLPAADQKVAQRLLVRLVGFSDIGGQETRRRVALGALRQNIQDPEQRLDAVLAAFVDARLLVRSVEGGETLIEVAHEALIRKWERLQALLREDRERLTEVRELEQWAEQYQTYRTLLRGPQLGYAQRLAQKYPDELGPVITRMVRDSVSAKFWLRFRQFGAIACALAALTVLYARAQRSELRALRENRIAVMKARIAQSRLLGMHVARALDSQPDVALLLATRALELVDEHHSRSTLFTALERTRAVRAFLRPPRGPLRSLAFSPHGDRLAAAGAEPAVFLYDSASGAQLERLPASKDAGEPAEIYAVAYSPDGRRLAGGGSKGRLWLWNPDRPAEPAELVKTSAQSIYSLDFSRDGLLLAAGAEDGRVLLFDPAAHALREPLSSGRTQLVSALSFSAGPRPRLAVGTADGAIGVFDALAGARLLGPLQHPYGSVSSVAWSPDGRLLATGHEDRAVLLWDAATGRRLGEPLIAHSGAVSGIGFGADGHILASCGLDRELHLWSVASGQTIGKPLSMREPVESCTLSADGRLLASGGASQLLLWELSEHPARHRQSFRIAVSALAVEPQGRYAVIGGPDGSIRRWDLATAYPGPSESEGTGASGINALAYSPDGQLVLVGSADGAVRLLRADSFSLVRMLPGARGSAALAVAVSPRGDTVAAGFADGALLIWEPKSGQLRAGPIAARQQAITVLGFTRTGEALVTGGLDGSLAWRDPRTGSPLCPPSRAHDDAITSLTWPTLATEKTFATGSRDKSVALWADRCSAQPLERLARQEAAVTAVSYSPDGNALVAATEDATIAVWEVKARLLVGQWQSGHERPITALAMGPSGVLLTGDEETIWRWDLYRGRWPSRACRRANRNLSLREWQQYLGDSPYCRICPSLPAGAEAPADAPACVSETDKKELARSPA